MNTLLKIYAAAAILLLASFSSYLALHSGVLFPVRSNSSDGAPVVPIENEVPSPSLVESPENILPGGSMEGANSVKKVFESRSQLLNADITIEDMVTFEYRCTDNEGPEQDCSTVVFLGSMSGSRFYVREGGQYVNCKDIVSQCMGWQKDTMHKVRGVLGVPPGSESFAGSYFVDVTSKEVLFP